MAGSASWEMGKRGIEGKESSGGVGLGGFGSGAGAMGAVGAACEFENHGAVDEAVEEGRRQRGVAEVVGPGGEVDVGRQRRRAAAGAGVEEAVVQAAGLGVRLTFQAVETEFVDQQKIEPCVFSDD